MRKFIFAAIAAIGLIFGGSSVMSHTAAHADDFGSEQFNWTPNISYSYVYVYSPWSGGYTLVALPVVEVLTVPYGVITAYVDGFYITLQADNWGLVAFGAGHVGSITSPTGSPIYSINTGGSMTYGSGWGSAGGGGNSVPYNIGADCFGEFGC